MLKFEKKSVAKRLNTGLTKKRLIETESQTVVQCVLSLATNDEVIQILRNLLTLILEVKYKALIYFTVQGLL